MTIIVGLGNPGDKYQSTRHNIGFAVIDRLAKELAKQSVSFSADKTKQSMIANIGGVLLVKPQVYMNESGKAVAALASYYKCSPVNIWVIHDDIDLPLGKIRIRQKGGSGGHKGVVSIMQELSSDEFLRFRLGVGRGKHPNSMQKEKLTHRRRIIDHVLSRFNRNEAGELKKMIKRASSAVRLSVFEGVDKAMNRYN